MSKPPIVIIGAGPAGLIAAQQLAMVGFNETLTNGYSAVEISG